MIKTKIILVVGGVVALAGSAPVQLAIAPTGAGMAEVKKCLADTDIEIGWWCAPSIRIMLCESGACCDRDGDDLEAVVRAFAGGMVRPAVRPSGAVYGAQTTSGAIPEALSHTMYTVERTPRDVETFYEADPYPHNRFYSSAAQMLSQMAGAVTMGSQNILFYCLQYLDDPLEDPGYADAYRAYKPRLDKVRAFIAEKGARLEGVRSVWLSEDSYLTRNYGYGHGGQLADGAFLLAKMGLPYTTRADAKGPALMIGAVAETMSDDEIRRLLAGGVLLDTPAADLLAKRGFGDLLGVDVEMAEGRLPVIGERILPAAGLKRRGKTVNAFYILCAGTEGTVQKFATLKPKAGTDVWCEFTGVGDKLVTPSLTLAKNKLGGCVAVLATSVIANRSSGLYNLRKQELLGNLFERLSPGALPVVAKDAPGIWILANVSADGRELPCGTLAPQWKPSFSFEQMLPEFFIVRKDSSAQSPATPDFILNEMTK